LYFACVWFNIAITGDRLSSASVEIDKNSSLTLPYPGGKVCDHPESG